MGEYKFKSNYKDLINLYNQLEDVIKKINSFQIQYYKCEPLVRVSGRQNQQFVLENHAEQKN